MKAPHKRGVDAVRAVLLIMSEQEENVGEICLAHVYWGVLHDSCRHFSNPLSSEAAQSRYMYPKIARLPETILGHMADKFACNEPLMNVSVPRQWLGRGATAAAGYQSVGAYQKIPRWMVTTCGISTICSQKASLVRSSHGCHAEKLGKWPSRASIARDTRRRSIHSRV